MNVRSVPAHTEATTGAIDIESESELFQYLRATDRINREEIPAVQILRGGVSNKTVLVTRPSGERWVLKQALPKLRVASDWFSDPARIHVEAEGLRYLPRVALPKSIPTLVFEDLSQHLLAMEAAPEPHQNWKEQLLKGAIDASLVRQFGKLLSTIHGRSFEQRDELEKVFRDRSFFETLRLEPYYLFTATVVPEAKMFLEHLVNETRAQSLTLVHGDYSPKNLLVHDGKFILLDHEVAHFGDPAFDFGFSLTHLLSKALHFLERRSAFLEAAAHYWRSYRLEVETAPWFAGTEQRVIRHTIACVLARVGGRSPLEYLSASERSLQRSVALDLIEQVPATVPDLIASFGRRIAS